MQTQPVLSIAPVANTDQPDAAANADDSAAALPPLQHRTDEELRAGLSVRVSGADDAIAAARLVQDAADFMAARAGTTRGLTTVKLNDRSADRRGALGTAYFSGTEGHFTLSTRSTDGLMAGIERLRTNPWEAWTQRERQAFLQANGTVLHEASHVTLPEYTPDSVRSWRFGNRPIEEGMATLSTEVAIRDFMRHEYDVVLDQSSERIDHSTDAYTMYSERLRRLIDQATSHDPDRSAKLMARVADNTLPTKRERVIAEALATELGGDDVPTSVVDEIAKTIPGFVVERNGTRTRLMEIQSWLVDHKAGRATVPELEQRLAEIDGILGRAERPEVAAAASA